MRLLIKIYPDLAEMVFDNCITKSKQMNKDQDQKLHSPKTIVTMNYEFLDDAFYIKSPKPDEKGTYSTYLTINTYLDLEKIFM